ncbi:MAG: phenylacetate--CoA ligase family protein [Eubacterium sp.]|nr:phenylacetate--CoA ligase family protein [Eubacterium sp.]
MLNARSIAFWTKDFINGRTIRKYYDEIIEGYKIGVCEELVKSKIKKICEYASENTDFYSKKTYNSFNDFPVMNKGIYVENYEQFLSKEFSDLHGCRKMSTSGSTGTPFTVIHNSVKTKRCNASVVFFNGLADYHLGEKMTELRVWSSGTDTSKFRAWMKNLYMYDISYLDDESLLQLLQKIKKDRVKTLIGYSSTYTALVKSMKRMGIDGKDLPVKSIIAASESLPDETAKGIEELFGVRVTMRYSNMENGIMAERFEDNRYYIDSSSFYIEILDEDDKPVPQGEVGRIVVTDLYNHAFPMIRYDTGDTGAVVKENTENNSYRLWFTDVYGRRTDMIYNTKGNMLSPHVITNNMWDIPKVKQYKFIQKDVNDYVIELNVEDGFDQESKVIQLLSDALGADSNVQVKYVDEIPVLASGKRRYIVNEMNNKK